MLTISEFGRRTGLSHKALRLYDVSGLLPPAQVDPANGYRLYDEEQLERARRISVLRQVDMPLTKIAEVLAGSDEEALIRLDRWWIAEEATTAARRATLQYLRDRLSRSGNSGSGAAAGADPRRTGDEDRGDPVRHGSADADRRDRVLDRRDPRVPHAAGATLTGESWVIYHGAVTPEAEATVEVCVPFDWAGGSVRADRDPGRTGASGGVLHDHDGRVRVPADHARVRPRLRLGPRAPVCRRRVRRGRSTARLSPDSARPAGRRHRSAHSRKESLMDYAVQTEFSDPGVHAGSFDALPDDIAGIGAVVRNLLIHYRGGGIEFTGDRLAEIDHRWVSAMLTTDQKRNGTALAVPREPVDRLVGCCRTTRCCSSPPCGTRGSRPAAGSGSRRTSRRVQPRPRRRGVLERRPLGDDRRRARAGRATSRSTRWTCRRVRSCPRPRSGWASAPATSIRISTASTPGLPIRGGWFIRNYVHFQLAHLQGDELLLWDNWGTMSGTLDGADVDLTDQVARLLVASDNGDETAGKELTDLYRIEPGPHLHRPRLRHVPRRHRTRLDESHPPDR